MNGIEFTEKDVVKMVHGTAMTADEAKKVAEFIKPYYMNGRTHNAMGMIAFKNSNISRGVAEQQLAGDEVNKLLSLTKINVGFFNALNTTDKPPVSVSIFKYEPATPSEADKSKAILRRLGHHYNGSSNMFGMLLEKCHHSNEA